MTAAPGSCRALPHSRAECSVDASKATAGRTS
jgi:hypothetical protein